MKKIYLVIGFIVVTSTIAAQNVGIGTTTPAAKLHIKGTADTTQLLIVANSIQSNTKPLIRLRKSNGSDLMWIHSDDFTNSFVGLNAGRMNDAGSGGTFNTFIGSGAGFSNTLGSYNTASGRNVLFSNTTGDHNTAYGFNALFSNTTGGNNTAYGAYALFSNTTGYYNTANGRNALFSNTTGNNNTVNGYQALLFNTTGSNNTASGYEASKRASTIRWLLLVLNSTND